ncbi:MAG: DUF2442 domain-containing protein [Peptostreptococcaceae bacterium]|nr:DUF2442 domain-containing protein [Peptostreptococcaceae bacterium]
MSEDKISWSDWFSKIDTLSDEEKEKVCFNADVIGTLVAECGRKSLSVKDLAELSDVSEETIRSTFNLEETPSIDTLCKLCKALGYKIGITRVEEVFHPVREVFVMQDFVLRVVFESYDVRDYDVKELAKRINLFEELLNDEMFEKVHVDTGGFGISWNEDFDLYCEELWQNSTPVKTDWL